MLDLGGLCRMPWAEKRGMKCGPARFPDIENVRRIYRLYRGYIFNGWAVKQTPNAMKLGRRSVYTIIRPHDKLQPIPRTFFLPLI